jgi:hypothetical protein
MGVVDDSIRPFPRELLHSDRSPCREERAPSHRIYLADFFSEIVEPISQPSFAVSSNKDSVPLNPNHNNGTVQRNDVRLRKGREQTAECRKLYAIISHASLVVLSEDLSIVTSGREDVRCSNLPSYAALSSSAIVQT